MDMSRPGIALAMAAVAVAAAATSNASTFVAEPISDAKYPVVPSGDFADSQVLAAPHRLFFVGSGTEGLTFPGGECAEPAQFENFDGPAIGIRRASSTLAFVPDAPLSGWIEQDITVNPLPPRRGSRFAPTASHFAQEDRRSAETDFAISATPVPEPGEWAMIGVGVLLIRAISRRRRNPTNPE
jgi:hypothetical protein